MTINSIVVLNCISDDDEFDFVYDTCNNATVYGVQL